MANPKRGDNCPKCGKPLVVQDGMFYFRGISLSGLFCEPCKALWNDSEGPTIFDVAAESSKHPDGPAGFCVVCKKTTIHTCSACAIKNTGSRLSCEVWLCGEEACVKAHGHRLEVGRPIT